MIFFYVLLVIILVFSVIVHEYMHARVAHSLGDTTAKDAGRLTLNPIPHIDLLGSIIVPLCLILILIFAGSGIIIGWAKPVPINFCNLRDKKYGIAKVAMAGPMANLAIALFFGLILRVFSTGDIQLAFLQMVVWINLLLMTFNLVPIPPLDGSKILMTFLPPEWKAKFILLERYGLFLLIFFLMFCFRPIVLPILSFLFELITGMRLF